VNLLGVIPARWASVRLPGKPLAEIAGRPMIEHVWRRASMARRLRSLVVATDDVRIAAAVEGFGGRAVMTRGDHVSGTDRIWEAVQALRAAGELVDAVVNIQGDEPLIDPGLVDAVAAGLVEVPASGGIQPSAGSERRVVTAAAPLEDHPAVPSVVKVVCDRGGYALYFSRAAIPHGGAAMHHVGIYGYTVDALSAFVSRPPGPLERAERLEQLRFLEYGDRIRVIPVDRAPVSVDTPEDLARVRLLVSEPGV
jgi:3-deoxy-manno-octulosonate cytidylyltransferase (CMP-KDO synthetase)